MIEINLEIIWNALSEYRIKIIPEGNPINDAIWSDICTEMAWITEELGLEHE